LSLESRPIRFGSISRYKSVEKQAKHSGYVPFNRSKAISQLIWTLVVLGLGHQFLSRINHVVQDASEAAMPLIAYELVRRWNTTRWLFGMKPITICLLH
jgi:hypothetical protein